MTDVEWKAAVKFDSTDWGWVIMSIGMAIGAGIVFLPVQVGLVGIWVYLFSAIIAYPAIYLLQRLFINTLADSPRCEDYPSVISGYLGKNWGFLLGILYFLSILICVFMYSTALTNDSASFLYSFGVTDTLLSDSPFYGLAIICVMVALASRGEQLLFRMSTLMVLTKLLVVICLGGIMVQHWNIANIGVFPDLGFLIKNTIAMLPVTLTSILFLPSISPMVISYRSHHKSIYVARYKAMRAMKIAFSVLFITIFSYAMSFNLAMGHEQAVEAYSQNISALAIVARGFDGSAVKIFSLILNIFSVMTAFFSVFLGFREACGGIALNILRRVMPEERINKSMVKTGILVFAVAVAWGAIVLNAPVLKLLTLLGPIFGLIGCLIPAYLVYKVNSLHKYKGITLVLIIFAGVLLVVSPFLAFF
ncbi:hypothetical protein DKB62_05015 [Megasphaera stantonii]|uniref:Transporter n=2 Tax=Megasphaera stantonii TaxID=2144175 RepID=A0A346B2M2_9FIRM|nr:hypothetical protein DKB62_05015 [Megasphaera stantonii]